MYNPFFTSDLHFFHGNVIKYCNRPYKDREEMNRKLIESYNKTVSDFDDVFILGDVSFGGLNTTVDFLKKMKGRKHLIAGNHDASLVKREDFVKQFVWVKDYHEIKIEANQYLILCHYPIHSWNGKNRGSFHLHGHCHGKMDEQNKEMLRYDVGVDSNDYKPVRYETIKEILGERKLAQEIK